MGGKHGANEVPDAMPHHAMRCSGKAFFMGLTHRHPRRLLLCLLSQIYPDPEDFHT